MRPTDQRGEPRRLADFLRARHDEIIARWEAEVRRLRPARTLTRPTLLDHMPDFLRELADFVDDVREQREVPPPQEFPTVHALERLDLGYDLTEVVSEYAALRRCITTLAQQQGAPALASAELPRLHTALDLAISASVARYSHARERTLKALDRISTAALANRDLAQFLQRTVSVLLETTASIDSSSILLVEGDRLVVTAAAGLALHPDEAPRLARGECFAGRIWETQEPLFVRDAESDPLMTTDTIRRRGTHATYGVPLQLGSELIGVAVIASCSTYEFSHEDLLLFRTAASRAAALIAQERLNEALRRQNSLYESIVSALTALGEGFAILEGRRVVFVNGAFGEIVGRSPEELYSLQDATELIVPAQREALVDTARQQFQRPGDVPALIETVFVHGTGRHVDVELGIERKQTGRIIVIARDVTARMALERDRAEQRARLETVLRVLPIGVVIADAPSGRLVLRNAEFDRIWARGQDADSVEAYGSYEGYRGDGGGISPHEWPLSRAIERGETVLREEIHVVAADGIRRITEQSAAPVKDSAGKIVAGVVTLVDISDRKRTEEELRAALSFRDEMLNILSHDLRQPLAVIGGSASILLRKEGLEEHAPIFARQLRTVDRMERMIHALLDYARASRGTTIPIDRKEGDLREVIEQALEPVRLLHPKRDIRLSVVGCPDCRGAFDHDRMLQVFSNLLGNAVTYSPEGTAITLTLREDGRILTCEVHNDGPPIPADVVGTIFEPFRRASTSRNAHGLGLGLFIVQQIVAAHGGRVTVSSADGQGTTFAVHLPKA